MSPASSSSDVPGILVTAFSQNHFAQLYGLIRTAQEHLPPSWQIVAYDLLGDAKHAQDVSSWCGVHYRRFNISRVASTWMPNYLTLSVWKPIIIQDCLAALPDNGIVIYADTSTRFHQPLTPALLAAVHEIGFVGRQTASPVAMYAHPDMAGQLETMRLRRYRRTFTGDAQPQMVTNLSARYLDAPMVCGCVSLWAHTPAVMRRLIAPWVECVTTRDCILPPGADGQDNRIGLSKVCRAGLGGHCHRGDQAALSIILYEAFDVHRKRVADYLRNTEVSKETWTMCRAWLHGTLVTTERSNHRLLAPMLADDTNCTRTMHQGRGEPNLDGSPLRKAPSLQQQSAEECSQPMLTRVAVPTGVQPIFPGMGGPVASLRRLLKPCATEHACTAGSDGCHAPRGSSVTIGRCNDTHAVEYAYRLPADGEAAIVSFFNPSAASVRDVLAAVARARPRLYVDFEPPVHARVPQDTVLQGVDGQMTYARRALVQYPYVTAAQIWSAAQNVDVAWGFGRRRPAIAIFVSNCRGHRAEAIDWLRQRFEVHSYGACRHGGNFTGIESARRQRIEGGHFPECLQYRAILAIENNACEDYVSEKLLEAVRCGAVPIVRTHKGLPDYHDLFGPLPLLDAEKLDGAFEARLRQVLHERSVWETYIPSRKPDIVPSASARAALTPRSPHCQIIDVVARYQAMPNTALGGTPLRPIRCETWYKLNTPRGMHTLPREHKAKSRET